MRLDLLPAQSAFTDFPARIDSHAAAYPDKVAVKDSVRQLTWAELSDRVRQGSVALADLAVQPGDKVALLAENGVPFAETFFAIVGTGACVVTIPTMLPVTAIVSILENAAPTLIMVSERLMALLQEAVLLSESLSDVKIVGLFHKINHQSSLNDLMQDARNRKCSYLSAPDDDFNIVYSSGTTGDPKGILHSYATRVAQSSGMAGLGYDDNTVTLISTPLYTNLSIPALLATVWSGGTTIIMEKFDTRAFLDVASRERATHFYLVPVQIQRLIEAPDFQNYDLSATRLVYVAGSMFQVGFKKKLQEVWPGTLVEVYGMTEGAPASILLIRDNPQKLSSVGKPVPGCDVRVIDEDGNELPSGKIGEIVGHSGTMMKGYYRRPAETSALIWRDSAGRTYFRSGDIGYFDEDGFLYIVDRKKDMIISGGLNIYASDIEDIVMTHDAVAEVAVIGVPSARWGETPVAVVVPKMGTDLEPQELCRWINARVAKHQRVALVEIFSSLPRNALGKIMKRELREMLTRKGITVK